MATVVTAKGREIASGRFIGTSPTQAEPKFCSWGLNPAGLTASVTDVALFQEGVEARTSGTSAQTTTTTTNDTYQVSATVTATGSRTVQEAALFDASTQPAQGSVAAGGVVGSGSNTTLNTAATLTPGNGNYLQIRTEVLLVSSGSGSTALTVARGQNGSSAISTISISDPIVPGNPPGQTGITGGNMYAKGDFTGIGLSTGDSIAFTWKVAFA